MTKFYTEAIEKKCVCVFEAEQHRGHGKGKLCYGWETRQGARDKRQSRQRKQPSLTTFFQGQYWEESYGTC